MVERHTVVEVRDAIASLRDCRYVFDSEHRRNQRVVHLFGKGLGLVEIEHVFAIRYLVLCVCVVRMNICASTENAS
jgi:hypothetical protein